MPSHADMVELPVPARCDRALAIRDGSMAASAPRRYRQTPAPQPMDGWIHPQVQPELRRWAARGPAMLRQIAPGAARMRVATAMLHYHLWRGDLGDAAFIVDLLPGVDPNDLVPTDALTWHESVVTYARFTGRHALGRSSLQAAFALSHQHGLQQRDRMLHALGAALELSAGDAGAAQSHVDAMRPLLALSRIGDPALYWHLQAGIALLRDEKAKAVTLARAALETSRDIDSPIMTAVHQLSLAQALVAVRQGAEALKLLDAAVAGADAVEAVQLAFTARLVRSSALASSQRLAEADADLRDALVTGVARDYQGLGSWWPSQHLAERLRRALQLGIETSYVKRWVRACALPCPEGGATGWPWPLTLRGFGELEILRHGEPLPPSPGRAAQRPLDLLRALLAHAPAPLPVATALQWLWPDTTGADERKPFDVALLRLRRLLGDDRLLRLEGGRLSLAPEGVWTDVHALAGLAQAIAAGETASRAQLEDWAQALPALVGGPLLAGVETPWARAARERQRQRFALAVDHLAARLETHHTGASRRLLEGAMDADPAAETIARRLMCLHVLHGRPAQAQRVLNLSAAMVELETGLALSPETRRAAARLGVPAP
jgi:DNA-binding SARP family transcriptional activator